MVKPNRHISWTIYQFLRWKKEIMSITLKSVFIIQIIIHTIKILPDYFFKWRSIGIFFLPLHILMNHIWIFSSNHWAKPMWKRFSFFLYNQWNLWLVPYPGSIVEVQTHVLGKIILVEFFHLQIYFQIFLFLA